MQVSETIKLQSWRHKSRKRRY